MGCGGSSEQAADPGARDTPAVTAKSRKESTMSNTSVLSTASVMSQEQSRKAHERLRKLRELDKATKIPFILVELRGQGDCDGYIEVCGKDEYGVYSALDEWFTTTWRCKILPCGDLNDDTPIPFSDRLYRWEGFRSTGTDGTSNMGLATMRLVEFMAKNLSWTLGVINGGNVGLEGEIREQQVIFKAPHPMNLVANHCMIELRSVGCIEVCADSDAGVFDDLDAYLGAEFKASPQPGHEDFCNRYYQCEPGVFKDRGKQGENNVGLLTTKVCDFMGNLPGWNLVTMNGGNYGERGTMREQQLVFRSDNHPLQAQPHLLVELRGTGYVEVNGEDAEGIYAKLDAWLRGTWRCSEAGGRGDALSNRKYKWVPKDMMVAAGEVVEFFQSLGWCMQVCSQGTVKVAGQSDSREQQIVLRPGMSGHGLVEPHLFLELYTGEGTEELYNDPKKTQVLGNQYIRMYPIGDCSTVKNEFDRFAKDYLGGEAKDDRYTVDCFLTRGWTDNNLGCWTMRVCDFMVDRLGWSFVVCNVCNLGERGQIREQQLVFRYDGERREIPVYDDTLMRTPPSQFKGMKFPSYWSIPEVLRLERLQDMVPVVQEEFQGLQEVLDATFRRILTRDRVYEYQATTNEEMPYRLELVHAFRSENVPLTKRFLDRRSRYKGGDAIPVKTREAGDFINKRLGPGEALLFHGTNPSSSISILKTGFKLDHAGKATGTMFGYGVYLAECCSKSDEYATDDNGGTYPGLRAMLVCRSLVGNPYVVHKAGDCIEQARSGGCDCVLGDRESTVNTYREFVFWDEAQIVPEYTLIYKRQYNEKAVPKQMIRKATGTTGRNWQVKLDKGWANVPLETNRQLIEAMKQKKSQIKMTIGNFEYTFDLDQKQQKNEQTGNVRQLRAPFGQV